MKNEHVGFARLVSATKYSAAGFKAAYTGEAAFRQEVWLAIVLIPLGLYLGDTPLEKGLLVVSVMLLMLVELLNSGIESVVDRIGEEYHELSGKAKDICSAAVMMAIGIMIVIWVAVLAN